MVTFALNGLAACMVMVRVVLANLGQFQDMHCVKSVRIRSYSGLHSVLMRENMDLKNSE